MIFDRFQVYLQLANFYLEAGNDELANELLRKALIELLSEGEIPWTYTDATHAASRQIIDKTRASMDGGEHIDVSR